MPGAKKRETSKKKKTAMEKFKRSLEVFQTSVLTAVDKKHTRTDIFCYQASGVPFGSSGARIEIDLWYIFTGLMRSQAYNFGLNNLHRISLMRGLIRMC